MSETKANAEKWTEIKRKYDRDNNLIANYKELEKESTWYNSGWYTSGIALWFFSSVVVALVPWGWGKFESNRQENKRIEKLNNEVKGRFDQLFAMIDRFSDSTLFINQESETNNQDEITSSKEKMKDNKEKNNQEPVTLKGIFFTFRMAPKSTKERITYFPTYKEFDEYSTLTILHELHALADKDDKNEIKQVISRLTYPTFIPTTDNFDVASFKKSIKDSLYQPWDEEKKQRDKDK